MWPFKKTEKPNEQIKFSNSDEGEDFNPDSSTWKYVVKKIDAKIAVYQSENENLSLNEKTTTELRARIDELRQLKKLPDNKGWR